MRVRLALLPLSVALLTAANPGQAKPVTKKPAARKPAAAKPAEKAPTAAAAKPEAAPPEEQKPAEVEAGADPSQGPASEMNSLAMLGVGVALTVVGTAGVVVGTTIAYRREANLPYVHFSPALPAISIAGGSALILAGIPLWIAGAWEVPVEPDKPEKGKTAVRIQPIVGPTGGSVRFIF